MAGVTLQEYRDETASLGFDGAATTALDRAINAARRELVAAQPWAWTEVQASTLTTSVGVGTYNLSTLTGTSVPAAAGEARTVSAVRAKLLTDTWELIPLERERFGEQAHRDTDNGEPRFWTAAGVDLSGSNMQLNVLITPKPDKVYTLVVDWEVGVVDLAAGPGDPIIPARLKSLVAAGALLKLSLRQRDANLRAMAEAEYARLLRIERAVDNRRQRQGSEQVVDSGTWHTFGYGC